MKVRTVALIALTALVTTALAGSALAASHAFDPARRRGGSRCSRGQRNESAVTRLTSVTASAGMPARSAAEMIASGLGASYRQ